MAVIVAQAALMVGQASAANPSANLDQCANDPLPSSHLDGCNSAATQWVNGNLGASKSVYFEGDSIPYRMRFDNLAAGSHTVTIKWDTTKSGKHAIDYLTTYNRTVANANPCLGVSGCVYPDTPDTLNIPADPQVTGAGVTPVAGVFTMFNGDLTNASVYSYPDGTGFAGDKSAQITLTFITTAAHPNPVLAWGGHISTRQDWGQIGSAVAISGSPYHMRLVDLDGAGGNQDRSLSADAVIFPGSITIIKNAIPDDAQDFSFTTTGGLSPSTFSLDDDANATLSNTQAYSNILTFTTYTFTEGAVANWTLSFGTPVCTVTSPNGGTQSGNATTRTLTIGLKEGENVTCTFTNTHANNTPSISTLLSDNSIVVGQSVTDSATLTGATSNAGGTVAYRYYATTAACDADTDGTGGSSAGTKTVTNGVVPDSDSVTFNAAGTFYFRAFYSGDSNNDAASSACADEVVTVGPASPSISTTLSATSGAIGDTIHDSSSLTGATSDAGGTVTYTVYTDNACTLGAQSAGTKTVTNGVVPDSDGVTFNSAGTFYWQAVYSGDANNSGASSTCTDETLVVNAPRTGQITPTGTTCAQFDSGGAATLSTLSYTVKSGKVNQVSPGVFFYWIKVTATAGSNTFTINQAITSSNNNFNHFFTSTSGSNVFTSSCTAVKPAPTISTSNGITTVTFTASTAGTYIIGVKYDAGSVKGFPAPSTNTTVDYTFQIPTVPGSLQGLSLVKKA
jgi:hypothetical protein